MGTISNCITLPVHYLQKIGTMLSPLNPSSFSVPNCCTVMSCCFVLNFTHFCCTGFSGSCFRSGWSVVSILLGFIPILYQFWFYINFSTLLNFHYVLLSQMKRVTQSCETAWGYNGILQDPGFFVSSPILNSSSQTKVIEHPASLSSPPKRDVEIVTNIFLLCSPFCCKWANAKGIPSRPSCFESCGRNYR